MEPPSPIGHLQLLIIAHIFVSCYLSEKGNYVFCLIYFYFPFLVFTCFYSRVSMVVSLPGQGVHGHLPPSLPRRRRAPAWALAPLASSGLHPAPRSVDLPPWATASKPMTVFACLPPLRPLPPAFRSSPLSQERPVSAAGPAPHSLAAARYE